MVLEFHIHVYKTKTEPQLNKKKLSAVENKEGHVILRANVTIPYPRDTSLKQSVQ